MTIDSNAMDITGGPRPPSGVNNIESMVMVLDCPCLALVAQLIQNLLIKPLTKFGTLATHGPRPHFWAQFLTAPRGLGEWSPTPVAHGAMGPMGPIHVNVMIRMQHRRFVLQIDPYRFK